ncbi:hypothetical protein BH10PLA2_BH10PLA2_22810 [soil metagenome]
MFKSVETNEELPSGLLSFVMPPTRRAPHFTLPLTSLRAQLISTGPSDSVEALRWRASRLLGGDGRERASQMSHFAYFNHIPYAKSWRGRCVFLARRILRRILLPTFSCSARRMAALCSQMDELDKSLEQLDALITTHTATHRRLDFQARALAKIESGEKKATQASPVPYRARCA